MPLVPVLLIVAAIYGVSAKPKLSDWFKVPDFVPSVVPTIPAPPADLQAAVTPVKSALSGHGEVANQLAGLFVATADILEKMPTAGPQTTRQLRDAVEIAGNLTFAGKAGPPGLAAALETAFGQMVGSQDDKALDASSRAKSVAAFRALAWAAQGA